MITFVDGQALSAAQLNGLFQSGSSIDGSPIGQTTAAAGSFTTLSATGTVTFPTLGSSDNSTKAATTAFVQSVALAAGAINPASVVLTGGTINGIVIGGSSPAAGSFTTLVGSLTGGAIDGVIIGGTTPAAITGTTLTSTGTATVGTTTGTGTVNQLIQSASGNTRQLNFRSGSSSRWTILANNTAETASVTLVTTADCPTGTNVLTFAATTGLAIGIFLDGNTNIPNGTSVSSFTGTTATLSANSTADVPSGSSIVFNLRDGTLLQIGAYSNNGINWGTPVSIARNTGVVTFNNGMTINQAMTITPRIVTASGAITMTTTDNIVIVNKTTGAATAVTLPASPVVGRCATVKDGKGDSASNAITISPASGTIDGAANVVINVAFGSIDFIALTSTTWAVM